MINKDTKIYCSFSTSPGNNGCMFFNNAFELNNINAIYKSFYSDDIEKSVTAVKTLGISGFAVSMPFKIDILDYVDELSDEVVHIGASNTIINNDGYLVAYNTDYSGVKSYFENIDFDLIYILGKGGFSKAVQYTCELMNRKFKIIDRGNWDLINELDNVLLFNATPLDITSDKNRIIDGKPFTVDGKQIALYQAKQQFKLYTGIEYE
jgi:shikimate 5-dehydrogenase